MPRTIVTSDKTTEDVKTESSLRPSTLSEYIGQEKVKKNLSGR